MVAGELAGLRAAPPRRLRPGRADEDGAGVAVCSTVAASLGGVLAAADLRRNKRNVTCLFYTSGSEL